MTKDLQKQYLKIIIDFASFYDFDI